MGLKKLLRETAIEIAAIGLVGLAAGTMFAHKGESNRVTYQPVAFSERQEIFRTAEEQDLTVDPFTATLTTVNDASAAIYSAQNHAVRLGDGKDMQVISNRLQANYGLGLGGETSSLQRQLDRLPSHSSDALRQMSHLVNARADLVEIIRAIDGTWRESHIDNYRIECDTSTDSNGNTRTTCRQVYVNTTHYFRYNNDQGERAVALSQAFMNKYPELSLDVQFLTAQRTSTENQYEMSLSRGKKASGFTDSEALGLANEWATNSYVGRVGPTLPVTNNATHGAMTSWEQSERTARTRIYTTFSRFHSGPQQFQVAEHLEDQSRVFHGDLNNIVSGFERARDDAAELDSLMALVVSGNATHDDFSRLKHKVSDVYNASIDPEHAPSPSDYRLWMTILGALAGALVGGAIGTTVNWVGGKKGWYDEVSSDGTRTPRFGRPTMVESYNAWKQESRMYRREQDLRATMDA